MPNAVQTVCLSCEEKYNMLHGGTCKECYEEASETEEELRRQIEDFKAKIAFLRLCAPVDPDFTNTYADLLIHGVSDSDGTSLTAGVPAHRAVLISRSPVFKAMLENQMEESKTGTIKIHDVSYETLRAFIKYMYTAEALLDEQMACDLLVLAEKYQVKHLKAFCEKFITSKVNSENAIASFVFAHRHHAKKLTEDALSLIVNNMATLTGQDEYKELVEKDPRLVVEIFEAYLNKQANTAKGRSCV